MPQSVSCLKPLTGCCFQSELLSTQTYSCCWPAGSKWTAAQQWCWQACPNLDTANYLFAAIVLGCLILTGNVLRRKGNFNRHVNIAARLVSVVVCRAEWSLDGELKCQLNGIWPAGQINTFHLTGLLVI